MKYNKTTYTEYTGDYDSPVESYETDQASATQVVDVTPGTVEGRRQAAIDFLGYATVKSAKGPLGNLVKYISRTPPMPYVDDPRGELDRVNRPLYCTAITRMKGKGAPSINPKYRASDYPTCRMWLRFDALPEIVDVSDLAVTAPAGDETNPLAGMPDEGQALADGNPRYIVRHTDWATALPSIRGSVQTYVDNFNPDNRQSLKEPLHFNDGHLVIQYRWVGVPRSAVPRTAFFQQNNTVNHDVFDGFPKLCLLFAGAREIPRVGPLGDDLSDVTLVFKAIWHNSKRGLGDNVPFPWGWLGIYRISGTPGVLDVWGLSDNGMNTGRALYDITDFRKLFQPPQT